MANLDDTIVAVSSPPGRSFRGLVRLSGARVFDVLHAMVADWSRDAFAFAFRLQPASLHIADHTMPVLLANYRKPRSYTGQDMAEIQMPGNPALLERVIHRAIEIGARLAEPGEFTFRAFMMGKLDLTQAEGVAATIVAASDGQLQAARLLRDGALGSLATMLVDRLGTQLALVESGIDFTDEEDVIPITPAELEENLGSIKQELNHVLAHSRAWGMLEGLPRVVFVGRPSTGKSTLFNALLGRTRAVIHPMPGTTRDVLAEPLVLPNRDGRRLEVMLVDIAGLDEPATALARDVQAAARRAIDEADLLLETIDGSCDPDLVVIPSQALRIRVRTKADDPGQHDPAADVTLSAHTGRGLVTLKNRIAERLADRAMSVSAQMLALTPRHETALRSAADHLATAQELLGSQRRKPMIHHIELIAGALRGALDELAALGGAVTPEDVLTKIFSTFCIGK